MKTRESHISRVFLNQGEDSDYIDCCSADSMRNGPRNPADSSAGGIGTVPFLCIDCVCIVLQFLCSYCLRFLHDICIFMCISDTVFELVYLIKYGYENNEATHISHRSMCPSISI